MKENVQRIGTDFEFHRKSFNKDYLEETKAGLQKLYALFSVEPIAKRQIHDGVSAILVKSTNLQGQHSEL